MKICFSFTREEPKPIPLCKDCRYCIPDKKWGYKYNDLNSALQFSKCSRPKNNQKVIGYEGEGFDNHLHCSTERNHDCGIKGKFWEPK